MSSEANASSIDEEINAMRSSNNPNALYEKAMALKGTNMNDAFKCFVAAADMGSVPAQKWASALYMKANQMDQGLRYMKLAADSGDQESQAAYGAQCYNAGRYPEAIQYLKSSGKKAHSCYLLGMCYKEGKGVAQSKKGAATMFERASKGGDLDGMLEYGKCMCDGIGVAKKDIKTGVLMIKESADKGNTNAMCELGVRMCDNGQTPVGLQYLEAAAKQGHQEAMLNIAKRTTDPAQAVAYYKKLTEMGNTVGQCLYGNALLTGQGVPANPVEGERLLKGLADHGVHQAQYLLGMAYANGTGVASDYNQAKHYMISSARGDFVPAQHELGCWYLHGKNGTVKNQQQGAKWIKTAADKNYVPALKVYAECLARGIGVLVSSEEAEVYRKRAADAARK